MPQLLPFISLRSCYVISALEEFTLCYSHRTSKLESIIPLSHHTNALQISQMGLHQDFKYCLRPSFRSHKVIFLERVLSKDPLGHHHFSSWVSASCSHSQSQGPFAHLNLFLSGSPKLRMLHNQSTLIYLKKYSNEFFIRCRFYTVSLWISVEKYPR